MLIFGMGLYELFVSTLEVAGEDGETCEVQGPACGSNLFGLFRLRVSLFYIAQPDFTKVLLQFLYVINVNCSHPVLQFKNQANILSG